ncbi:FxDxF family PEP-CTERM protein [Paucibacter soli]|uniref:FxDxF family PEP-CTERM protein n=1 Tax=Paucibacter soli TaxID=3133433 RepID=UPI00309B8470
MELKQVMAALAVAMAGMSAHAGGGAWAQHDPIELGFGSAIGAGSLLSDVWSFSLASSGNLVAVGVSNDGGVFNLTGGMVELYKVGNAVALDSFQFDQAAVNHAFGTLTAGNYYYKVTASVAAGALAGTYQLNSSLAPVPEPETYAMLLAGLGVVGFLARRRQSV